MRVSDVMSNVTKQNKTSWLQGTKLRVRLSLANARFASLLSKVMYIIKRKFKCLSWIWLLFHLVKWKKCIYIHLFTSLDEIKVIFTPNNWISSIYKTTHACCKEQWTLVTMTAFVSKDVAIKMNLLLYRILNEQIDMYERSCFVLISS